MQHSFDEMLDDESTTADTRSNYEKRTGEKHPAQVEADKIAFRLDKKREGFGRTTDSPWTDGPLTTRGGRKCQRVINQHGGVTQSQYEYIVDLLHDKNLFASPRFFDTVNAMNQEEYDEYMRRLISRMRNVTKGDASALITTLKALPKRDDSNRQRVQRSQGPEQDRITVTYEEVETERGKRRTGVIKGGKHDVLAGRYALDTSGDSIFSNDITFFKVWVGDRGGWKVRMFKSDEQLDLAFRTQLYVIRRIADDPVAALKLWGEHKSSCGVCGRKLTNDVSRALGIGPICRGRWSY